MNFRAVLAIVRKDALEVVLDKSNLFGLALPVVLSLMYASITALVNQAVQTPTRLLIYNPGGSAVAQAAAGVFSNAVVSPAGSAAEVAGEFGPDGAAKDTPYAVGLSIPERFDQDLRAGNQPQLALYINGSEVGAATGQVLQAAIENYGYRLSGPQAPFEVGRVTVNPRSETFYEFDHLRYFTSISILLSMMVGMSVLSTLFIEEKEKKTLRLLMVTPASLADIVAGKLLVSLGFQLAITAVVLAIYGGISGQVSIVLLYVLFGACFSLSLGLFFGVVLESTGTAMAVVNGVGTLYLVAGVFAGPFVPLLGDHPLLLIARIFPTHHLANGVYDAQQNVGTFGSHVPGLLMLLGTSLLFFLLSIWMLRRQPTGGKRSTLNQLTS
jgi:ABC-2 type transport system permease protein